MPRTRIVTSRTSPVVFVACAALLGGGLLIALAGCYAETDSSPAPRQAEAPAETDATGTETLSDQGGGSALGSAKQSAKNTVSDLERRSADIEKQIEDDQ